MKKILAVISMMVMIVVGCVGCTEKLEDTGVVADGRFTFNTQEFKEVYNSKVPEKFQITKEFKEEKLDDYDVYYVHSFYEDFNVGVETDAEGAKLTEVSVEYKGGTESQSGVMSEISFTSGQINTFYKRAEMVYKVCCPNVSKSEFKAFFDSVMDNGYLLKEKSKVIGDVEVIFNPKYGMEFTFKPSK
ncbi:MAG: hypothetical protein ACRCTE_01960 [Cellulosilyticaceae bacterium]